ncbi:FAD-dependent oxidoreductase [Actinoplanes sp. N902-109]|uniref:FAD-dependent oxidoreductase n=1 Tax=Actinoplanes sp. (strain N902-109) TaxID=649831 RepID=UPI00032945D0|nr:FAD-dependent oxidoreductase [Actinoplanes sp. N902-109]AGL18308.1 D-aspartate oxidase [Actinoplanes sp. N902-109]
MTSPQPDVVIIGAGVSGLTTGILLAEAGKRVLIRTAQLPAETTSAAAGALWDHDYAQHPQIPRWGRRTYDEWTAIQGPHSGVRFVTGIGASRVERSMPVDFPAEAKVRACPAGELPRGFLSGWRCTLPVVDMPVYLSYLEGRFVAGGGTLDIGRIKHLEEVFDEAGTVVNCAGIGAAALVKTDSEIEAVRGELVVVDNPGISEFFAEYTDGLVDMVYLLPQGDKLVLGGTADRSGRSRRHEDETAAHIIDRCARIRPEVLRARILEYRVGVRPERAKVRVERELVDGFPVVHNYGHGGSGVTLSWGCAERVAELIDLT